LRHPSVIGVHLWPASKCNHVSYSELESAEGLFNSGLTLKITIFLFGFLNPEHGTDRCLPHNNPEECSSQPFLN
jgi:hypothetical protein